MTAVGIRELKERTSEVVRRVREEGETIDVTYRGQVVAHLVPARSRPVSDEEWAAIWATRNKLIEDIGAHCPKGVSAVDAIREQRREFAEQTTHAWHEIHEQDLAPPDGQSESGWEPLPPSQRPPINPERVAAWWAEMDGLAAAIGARWPDGVSAVDAIQDVRRDL